MQQVLFIALGGSLGAVARYGVSSYVLTTVSEIFPWGTLIVNLSGSFLMGVVIELFEHTIVPPNLRSLITIGFLGAYTTFSTYSMETVNLLRDGEVRLATTNFLLSNVLACLLFVLGLYCSRASFKLFS
jgi:CrcB protein